MRSTAFPRFSIERSVSRSRRLASVEVQRSSQRWTGKPKCACKFVGEKAHLFRLRSLGAAQAQRQADHNLPNFILRQHLPLRASKSRRLFCRWIVSSPCAVMPSGSVTATPIRLGADVEGEDAARQQVVRGIGASLKL